MFMYGWLISIKEADMVPHLEKVKQFMLEKNIKAECNEEYFRIDKIDTFDIDDCVHICGVVFEVASVPTRFGRSYDGDEVRKLLSHPDYNARNALYDDILNRYKTYGFEPFHEYYFSKEKYEKFLHAITTLKELYNLYYNQG